MAIRFIFMGFPALSRDQGPIYNPARDDQLENFSFKQNIGGFNTDKGFNRVKNNFVQSWLWNFFELLESRRILAKMD